MVVGILSVEIFIPAAASLKEKRQVVKSVKQRLRNKFNVSVTEADYHDKWQRAIIAVALVSEKQRFAEESLNKVFSFLDRETQFEIIQFNFDYC